MSAPRIHAFCRDAFLLARFGGPSDRRPDGRAWERAVSRGLWMPGVTRRQHAGTLGLFGGLGRSGARHELDGAGHGGDVGIWLEAKARAALEKADVAVFAFKTLDLYRESAAVSPAATARGSWWPILVSSEPCSEAVHRSCIAMGVTLCEPTLMPIPSLLHIAGKPVADTHLGDRLLGELVRLGERVSKSVQQRWPIDAEARTISLSLDEPGAREIGDLLYVQRELSGDLLDYYDRAAPGELERRGTELGDRLSACARVW